MFPTDSSMLRVLVAALVILSFGSLTLLAAPPITVESADPSEAERGTGTVPDPLTVWIGGRNFPAQANTESVSFWVTGCGDNCGPGNEGGVTVLGFQVRSKRSIEAQIIVSEDAELDLFDIEVIEKSSGRKGKGIGLFRVLQKGHVQPPEDPPCPDEADCIDGVDEHLGRPIGFIDPVPDSNGGSISLGGDECPDFFAVSDVGIRLYSGANREELSISPIPRRGRNRDQFGYAVAAAGDWDSDGVPDLVVGAPGAGGQRRGQVFVISGHDGSTDFLEGSSHAIGDHRWMNKGFSVAGIMGDTDNDGYQPEILVGSHDSAHIIEEGEEGLELFNVDSPEGGGGLFGWAVAAGGDLDGDRKEDFAVGAPDSGGAGRAHAYSGLDRSFLFSVSGEYENDDFGSRVDIAPDVDGDECDDLIVGAYFHDGLAGADTGAFYVYGCECNAGALVQCVQPELKFSVTGEAGDLLGRSVAGVGDLNGDGRGDVLVGAPGFDQNRGKVNLFSYFFDSTLGRDIVRVPFSESGLTNQFGRAVAGQPDVSQCPTLMPEIMIEEPFWGVGSDDGRIYLYRDISP